MVANEGIPPSKKDSNRNHTGCTHKKLQPLDLCVNKSFKAKLGAQREKWINGVKEVSKSSNVKSASYEHICQWISKSWDDVSVSIIKNGFIQTKINPNRLRIFFLPLSRPHLL